MEYVSFLAIVFVLLYIIKVRGNDYASLKKESDERVQLYKDELSKERVDLSGYVNRVQHLELIQEYKSQLSEVKSQLSEANTDKHRKVAEFSQLEEKHKKVVGQKKSSEVRLGQISENIIPFLEDFPYDSKNIRGLFNPIDLLCFEKDAIVFVELKSGGSKLSPKQKNIKELVEENKVRFETWRLDENGLKKEEK